VCASAVVAGSRGSGQQLSAAREIPRVWDETALAEWATPIAGLNVRPTNMSAKDCYAMAVANVRTYPVYFPGHEPAGYWEMLQQVGRDH
jgi:hypothetical protein